eukprot:g3132.t1
MSTKVALVGVHGSGKNTFLRLLSSRLLPDEGEIFVPTHLRILFVAQDPVLLDASVWENLTYGAPNTEIDVVKGVLKMLQMKNILAHLQAELLGNETANQEMGDEEQGLRQPNRSPVEKISDLSEPLTGRNSQSRSSRTLSMNGNSYKELPALDPQELAADAARDGRSPLTYTEKVKVSLARALIMNPHLLVLHRPFHHFDLGTADDVLNVIQIHHENRGASLPQQTLIFGSPTVEQAQKAHTVWQIDHHEKTVREVKPSDLNHRFEPMRPAQADAKLKYWAADDPYSFSSHVRHAAKRSWQRAIELLALRPTWDVVSCSCALRCPWSQALALMAAIAKKETMETVEADPMTFSSVVSSLEKCTQWQEAVEVVSNMASGRLGDAFAYSAAIGALQGRWRHALVLFEEMCGSEVKADVICFSHAMHPALNLLKSMRSQQCQFDIIICNAVISCCEKRGDWPSALEILEMRRCMLPHSHDVVGCSAAVSACEKAKEWRCALQLLSEQDTRDTIICNSAISACEKCIEWRWSLRIVALMKEIQVQPDAVSCNAAISACENASLWRWAIALPKNDWGMAAMISACEKAQNWTSMLHLLMLQRLMGLVPGIISFEAALRGCRLRWKAAVFVLASTWSWRLEATPLSYLDSTGTALRNPRRAASKERRMTADERLGPPPTVALAAGGSGARAQGGAAQGGMLSALMPPPNVGPLLAGMGTTSGYLLFYVRYEGRWLGLVKGFRLYQGSRVEQKWALGINVKFMEVFLVVLVHCLWEAAYMVFYVNKLLKFLVKNLGGNQATRSVKTWSKPSVGNVFKMLSQFLVGLQKMHNPEQAASDSSYKSVPEIPGGGVGVSVAMSAWHQSGSQRGLRDLWGHRQWSEGTGSQ